MNRRGPWLRPDSPSPASGSAGAARRSGRAAARARAAGRGWPSAAANLAAGITAAALALAVPAAAAPNRESVAATPPPAAAVPAGPAASPTPAYADLADLADGTPAVVRAKVRSITPLEAARAPGLRPGEVRLYVEARTIALIAGQPLAGDSLRYLVDVPLDARGKPPRRPKADVILFARTTPGRPGELQLVAPDAQLVWSEDTEARLKGVLAELLAPDAPPRISGVREAIHVAGALAGEGETQLFLASSNGEPASITVVRRPGAAPRWSVSFSEVLDASGEPPARDTLAWYRLACFLPPRLSPQAHVSASAADRAEADADYRFVLDNLGPCPRTRG